MFGFACICVFRRERKRPNERSDPRGPVFHFFGCFFLLSTFYRAFFIASARSCRNSSKYFFLSSASLCLVFVSDFIGQKKKQRSINNNFWAVFFSKFQHQFEEKYLRRMKIISNLEIEMILICVCSFATVICMPQFEFTYAFHTFHYYHFENSMGHWSAGECVVFIFTTWMTCTSNKWALILNSMAG